MKMKTKIGDHRVMLAKYLKHASNELKVNIWKDVSKRLLRSSSTHSEVNLKKIDSLSKEGDIIVVPGKVLGYGEISKALTVSAFGFSASAKEKIVSAGGKAVSYKDLIDSKPDYKKVKLVG
jgi:large subunit ribosomal protein L18e